MSLTYQWYKNGVAIDGATSATFSKESATSSDSGYYYCIVTNESGNIKSHDAYIHIIGDSPCITSQPIWNSVYTGDTATATLTANGDGILTYQWYKDNLVIAGETSGTITIENVQEFNNGSYFCIVSNAFGAAKSNEIQLYVNPFRTTREDCSIGVSPYFFDMELLIKENPQMSIGVIPELSDIEQGVDLGGIAEYETIGVSPHFSDADQGIYSGGSTELVSIGVSPYFVDTEQSLG